ncbi:MAG: hypothetical protein K6B67_05485 [Lachnospiraceae bacterium]|nr:hypothetical protein [Lachnospiraceae bacterium]
MNIKISTKLFVNIVLYYICDDPIIRTLLKPAVYNMMQSIIDHYFPKRIKLWLCSIDYALNAIILFIKMLGLYLIAKILLLGITYLIEQQNKLSATIRQIIVLRTVMWYN